MSVKKKKREKAGQSSVAEQTKTHIEDHCIHKNTWSQSSSSMVPLMFLKNSVSWLPLFLSASDAATPAYISTAETVGHKSMISSDTCPGKFWRKMEVWVYEKYLEGWTHGSPGKPSQNSSQQEFLQFHTSSCISINTNFQALASDKMLYKVVLTIKSQGIMLEMLKIKGFNIVICSLVLWHYKATIYYLSDITDAIEITLSLM